MILTTEEIRVIIKEELQKVLKEQKKLDEGWIRDTIIAAIIGAGMASTPAEAGEKGADMDNSEIVQVLDKDDSPQAHKIISMIKSSSSSSADGVDSSVEQQSQVTDLATGDTMSMSNLEATIDDCEVSIESIFNQSKKEGFEEGELSIICEENMSVNFIFTNYEPGNHEYTLTVKKKGENQIDLKGQIALSAAKVALAEIKKLNPKLEGQIKLFKTARQMSKTGVDR